MLCCICKEVGCELLVLLKILYEVEFDVKVLDVVIGDVVVLVWIILWVNE